MTYEPWEADPEDLDYDGDQQDLADRLSLRRVAGMSTQLADITEVEYRELQLERVVLVSVWTTGSEVDADNAMAELKLLAETAGSQVLEGLVQRRSSPDPATFIGRGKVDEVRQVVIATGADTVICDGELEPAPRPPLVLQKPVSPASASTARSSTAARTASPNPTPGWGSRSMRNWSTTSVSAARTGHGWKRTVPRFTIHAMVARSAGATSTAVRPDGKRTSVVCTHSGVPDGARFW